MKEIRLEGGSEREANPVKTLATRVDPRQRYHPKKKKIHARHASSSPPQPRPRVPSPPHLAQSKCSSHLSLLFSLASLRDPLPAWPSALRAINTRHSSGGPSARPPASCLGQQHGGSCAIAPRLRPAAAVLPPPPHTHQSPALPVPRLVLHLWVALCSALWPSDPHVPPDHSRTRTKA